MCEGGRSARGVAADEHGARSAGQEHASDLATDAHRAASDDRDLALKRRVWRRFAAGHGVYSAPGQTRLTVRRSRHTPSRIRSGVLVAKHRRNAFLKRPSTENAAPGMNATPTSS